MDTGDAIAISYMITVTVIWIFFIVLLLKM